MSYNNSRNNTVRTSNSANTTANKGATAMKDTKKVFRMSADHVVKNVHLIADFNTATGREKEFACFKLKQGFPGMRLDERYTALFFKGFNLKLILKGTLNPESPAVDVAEFILEEGLEKIYQACEEYGIHIEDARNFNLDGIGDVLAPGSYDWAGRYTVFAHIPIGLREQVALSLGRVVLQYWDGKRNQLAFWLPSQKLPVEHEPYRVIAFTSETKESLGELTDGEWREPVSRPEPVQELSVDNILKALASSPELQKALLAMVEGESAPVPKAPAPKAPEPKAPESKAWKSPVDFLRNLK